MYYCLLSAELDSSPWHRPDWTDFSAGLCCYPSNAMATTCTRSSNVGKKVKGNSVPSQGNDVPYHLDSYLSWLPVESVTNCCRVHIE